MRKSESLVITYIYLAIASLIFGVIILFGMLAVCRYFDIDLWLNWWLLGISPILAVGLNVILIEMWKRYRMR